MKTAYLFDYQRERISKTCAIIMHIGKEIRKVMDQKGVKPAWLAQQISTSKRNMYDILKRADISTGVLVEISKYLGFNFLSLYSMPSSMVEETSADYGKLKHENAVSLYKATKDIKLVQRQCRHHTLEQTNTYLRDLGVLSDYDQLKNYKGAV